MPNENDPQQKKQQQGNPQGYSEQGGDQEFAGSGGGEQGIRSKLNTKDRMTESAPGEEESNADEGGGPKNDSDREYNGDGGQRSPNSGAQGGM